MLLTADIGNTNIVLGAFENDSLVFVSRLATERARTEDQYAVELESIFNLNKVDFNAFTGAIISSVVPELSNTICLAIKKILGISPLTLSPGLKTGLNILTDNPAEVGSDLVAGAVAASNKYPLPCLVMDLGTATKISVIDKNGAFCGCSIAPGIAISLEALSSRTSQLPNISFKAPDRVIGKNTVDSMRSGTVFGTASMLDGMCQKIEKELGEKIKTIVATGGLSSDIIKSCENEITADPVLILEGLKIIYEKNISKKR
ncbi:MAG: type III pantothenate kinase [Clostridiales bacterium]|nr:type III pantothenate kinase [Clostridiales bacterium]